MKSLSVIFLTNLLTAVLGFVPLQPSLQLSYALATTTAEKQPTVLQAAAPPDLDVIALVAGQENFGLALVALGEGVYSFVQAPSMSNIRVLIPPVLAAIVLVAVSGPMITSGDASAVGTGLWVATAVSTLLGASYVLRLLSPFPEVPKEVAALGLLVAVAGFFSFGQNLIVDGFVALPSISLPGIPMPPSDIGLERGVYL